MSIRKPSLTEAIITHLVVELSLRIGSPKVVIRTFSDDAVVILQQGQVSNSVCKQPRQLMVLS